MKGLCDQFAFDPRTLTDGTVIQRFPGQAVTFVDNHDTIRDGGNAVINEKLLAYALMLTSEGYPSVCWQDYFNFGLAGRGTANGIAALIAVTKTTREELLRCCTPTMTVTLCKEAALAISRG